MVLALLLGGGGWWGFQEWQSAQPGSPVRRNDLVTLGGSFEQALEKRQLDEAARLVVRLEAAGAGPEELEEARRRVAQGREEEKGQEVAFLLLNARGALEAGRLSEAERFCSQIERLEAGHPALAEIREAIKDGRKAARIDLIVEAIEKALAQEEWETAEQQLETLAQEIPGDERVAKWQRALLSARAEFEQRRERATELVAQAKALDDGLYSEEAMRLLAEATRLDPSKANQEVYRKMSAYGKVIKVPGDHETISAALAAAAENDRIMVAKGTYYESLRIPSQVTVTGASDGKTMIECPAKTGAVVTVPGEATGVRLVSLTLRHSGLVSDPERYPVLAVDGGSMEGEDLKILRASGHGVAVLRGGEAKLRRCEIIDSGWDGVAATGQGTRVSLSQTRSAKNLHHGVDLWDGASGVVEDSELVENGLNGFSVIGAEQAVRIVRTESRQNHEVGIYVTGGVGLTVEGCRIFENLLGGIFIGQEAKGVRWTGNEVGENGEAGVVLEKGVEVVEENENEVQNNRGKQIWREAVLPKGPGEETGSPPPAPPLE